MSLTYSFYPLYQLTLEVGRILIFLGLSVPQWHLNQANCFGGLIYFQISKFAPISYPKQEFLYNIAFCSTCPPSCIKWCVVFNKFLLSKCLAVHFNCDVNIVNDIKQVTCKLLKTFFLNRLHTGLCINVSGDHLLNKLKLRTLKRIH